MEIRIIVFDGDINKVIARESFKSVKELDDFMAVVKQLDARAKYSVLEIKK